MLIVVADAVVKPANRARMDEAGPAMIVSSREEAGCLGYSYAWDMIEPDRLRIVELWQDATALRFHFKTPHMAAFLKALGEMANVPPTIVGSTRQVRRMISAVTHAEAERRGCGLVLSRPHQGDHVTSSTSIKTDVINAGGKWQDPEVVVDQGLVTSRQPSDLEAFCKAMIGEMCEPRHVRRAA